MQSILAVLPPLHMFDGPWIAGGAVRRIIEGESLTKGDIDIFFGSSFGETHLWDAALAKVGTEIFKSAYATTYEVPIGDNLYRIQLIKRKGYSSVMALFRDFDFTICQMAYDGKNITASTQGLLDLAARKLATSDHGRTTKSNLLNRTFKYIRFGFMPGPGFLEKVARTCLMGTYGFTAECKNAYDWDKDEQETVDLNGF